MYIGSCSEGGGLLGKAERRKNMYRIGEFSRITSLTVKALRYYDEEGILSPSERDKNGYRLYNETDYEKARQIVLLRELDFSIMEIKDVLSACVGEEDLAFFLKEKQAQVRQRISKEKALLKKLEEALPSGTEASAVNRSYTLERKTAEELLVISIRFRGKYPEVGKYAGRLFKAAGSKACGAPFSLYYDEEYREEADIELCLPVSSRIAVPEITCRRLPEITALCTMYEGSYEELGAAYKALLDGAAERKLVPQGPSREIYLKGPGTIFRGNPAHYRTELMLPVAEEPGKDNYVG